MKNVLNEKNKLDLAEEKIKEISIGSMQNRTQREKKRN